MAKGKKKGGGRKKGYIGKDIDFVAPVWPTIWHTAKMTAHIKAKNKKMASLWERLA